MHIVLSWIPLVSIALGCDRGRSVEARIAIEEYLLPRLAEVGRELETRDSCPLALSLDQYTPWENAKSRSG